MSFITFTSHFCLSISQHNDDTVTGTISSVTAVAATKSESEETAKHHNYHHVFLVCVHRKPREASHCSPMS